MKYGEILKKLRTEKGLSQKELTDRLTINRSTYARYETSSTQPDFETLSKLADFYDVTVDYLLGRTHEKIYSYEDVIQHKLMKFRQDKKLTNGDIASKLGIPREEYSQIEYEGIIPKDLLEPIAEILGISIADLKSPFTYYEIKERQKDETEFQAFANDPSLQKWYKDLPKNREEDLQRLRKMWEILKDSGEIK